MCIEPQWLLRSPDHELPPRRSLPPVPARVVGYVAAGWCLGFAGVSAWLVAGGVTLRAILYVLFFLAGAALLGALAVWFHRPPPAVDVGGRRAGRSAAAARLTAAATSCSYQAGQSDERTLGHVAETRDNHGPPGRR
jgi:hypothetical protein